MGAVAIYVDGRVKDGQVLWAFVAPELGINRHGFAGLSDASSALTARYQGALEGLRWAEGAGYTSVLIHSGDPLFVGQMCDGPDTVDTTLQALWWRVKKVEAYFHRVAYFTVGAAEYLETARMLEEISWPR